MNNIHPTIDGRPILLGDWLLATDPHSVDLAGNIFTMEGKVVQIAMVPEFLVTLDPINGLTEDFDVETAILSFELYDNGFVCNRIGGEHKLGTTTCPACRVKS